jgi:tetratricopeptide (TPR) repeat protein
VAEKRRDESRRGKHECLRHVAFVAVLGARALFGDQAAGIADFQAGRYSEALKELLAADQKDPHVQLFLALTQAALGDCASAIPTLTKEPLDRLGGLAAVKCYSALGDSAREFSLLAELQKQFPNDADVLYLGAKQHMKAFNDATFAMFQRSPSSYRVHELSADIFEVQNRFDDAITEYRKAIELNPNAPDLHFRLGRALLLQSHSPEALEQAAAEFRSELRLNPEDASCEFQLGQIAQVETKAADARKHFEQAVKLAPTFVQALLALGKIEAAAKSYARAEELLGQAIKLEPTNEAAHYALMSAYRDSGQMDRAKTEKAVLDKLQKPEDGEFSNFLKKLGEKPAQP